MSIPKYVLLAVLAVALVCSASDDGNAQENSWLIKIKAVNPTTFGGGAATAVGVGTTTDTNQSWPTAVGSTANASQTLAYGDTTSQWRARKDVPRDLDGVEEYSWDLKLGARSDYVPDSIAICIWKNVVVDFPPSLAYAFYKGDSLLAWFSETSLKDTFTAYWKKPELVAGKWTDYAQLLKYSSSWSPTSTNTGFYVTDIVTKSAVGGFADLGDYRFEAFAYEPIPEPTSLLALGSGLLGAAGFALRKRRS